MYSRQHKYSASPSPRVQLCHRRIFSPTATQAQTILAKEKLRADTVVDYSVRPPKVFFKAPLDFEMQDELGIIGIIDLLRGDVMTYAFPMNWRALNDMIGRT